VTADSFVLANVTPQPGNKLLRLGRPDAGSVKYLVGGVNFFRNGQIDGAGLACGAVARVAAVTCRS
jgi:hypothetical protein